MNFEEDLRMRYASTQARVHQQVQAMGCSKLSCRVLLGPPLAGKQRVYFREKRAQRVKLCCSIELVNGLSGCEQFQLGILRF